MAENQPPSPPSPSSQSARPRIALPPRSSMENLFMGGPGASPGPMTLVSSFFAENDPRSFSQLLAGAMDSPAGMPNVRHNFLPSQPVQQAAVENKEDTGGDFRFQHRPAGLVVWQQPGMFTIPPGLSPASLLDSPGFVPPAQGSFGMSHQQILAQVSSQAQTQAQIHTQSEYPSLSAASTSSTSQLQPFSSIMSLQQQMPPPVRDTNIMKELSDVSQSDQKSQPPNFTVDKPTDDGYNWRKYGQKQVKGGEYPRSYYKCTHPKCQVKKKVERSLDGQITEIIYKGQHDHPQSSKRTKDAGNSNGTVHLQGNFDMGSEGLTRNLSKSGEGLLSNKDLESFQVTPEHISGSSDSEEMGETETRVDGRDDDEPESKRRNTEVQTSEQASSHRTVTEPRIIVQTTSEVDLLDDGYRWRKYGQKVVKGNPHPSYYKCTNPGCNVRKHVERAASDVKAVITTYEGKHNHDVPAAKNSSHTTANAASQSRPHGAVIDRQAANIRTEYENNEQQPIALLRLKEEQVTHLS
ncbi:probable WRKY transcription factor 4 [Olea europaea subsp. europaea]|uniref:Probable WRKY transcription factor 4 n=1 Tax=Olea europaea subsp. europaea TaxID=158383 RepID=A0A8S0ULS3_OLEEU|nr:probable WRKY transcription factor 4 [Olea europaea subsp. europaea]